MKTIIICMLLMTPVLSHAEDVAATVVSVYDGDTITVDIPGVPAVFGDDVGVRVLGVDTPEIKDRRPDVHNLAVQARDVVRGWCPAGGPVTLHDVGRDKYFRILARVECQGVDVAAELLRLGLAKPYDGGTKEGW